jgi:hypothetical protein
MEFKPEEGVRLKAERLTPNAGPEVGYFQVAGTEIVPVA